MNDKDLNFKTLIEEVNSEIRESLGLPEEMVDQEFARLLCLWRQYYLDCEEYDRTVCTGPYGRGGGILPANGVEQGKIMLHAWKRYQKMRWARDQADPAMWLRAKKKALAYEERRRKEQGA